MSSQRTEVDELSHKSDELLHVIEELLLRLRATSEEIVRKKADVSEKVSRLFPKPFVATVQR